MSRPQSPVGRSHDKLGAALMRFGIPGAIRGARILEVVGSTPGFAAVLLELSPTANLYGTQQGRLTFGLLIAFSTLSSGLGIADTYAAGRRAEGKQRKAALPVIPIPFALSHGGGLTAGGSF